MLRTLKIALSEALESVLDHLSAQDFGYPPLRLGPGFPGSIPGSSTEQPPSAALSRMVVTLPSAT